MSRFTRAWIVVAALLAVLGGLLAPTAAYAGGTVAPTVGVDRASGDEMTTFRVAASGFDPQQPLTVTVSVISDGSATSTPYTGVYTKTRPAGSTGWNWIWTTGDPYGSYTMNVSDGTSSAGASFIIEPGAPPTPAAGTHLLVDAASAPPLATMQAWQRSGNAPYRAIGVYLPISDPAVDDRHDKTQSALTPGWVSAVQGDGWRVLPIYVGLQAPDACQQPGPGTFHAMSSDLADAQTQGVAAADDALGAADKLGVDAGVPLVYDMESYKTGSTGCSAAVQSFLIGWTARLHEHGRLGAVYGSAGSAAKDLADAKTGDPTYLLPDVFWAATDNRRASTSVTDLPTPGWKVANQFLWGVDRSFGVAPAVEVDESAVDDAVWTLPTSRSTPADVAAPIVTMGGAPGLSRTAKANFAWSGVDAGSGLAAYEVRTRRTRGGHGVRDWSAPTRVAATSSGRTALALKPGEQGCVQVRGIDAVGNTSDWTLPACTSRLDDDRAAKPAAASTKRWHRSHQRGAYRRTLTTSTRAHAVLRLGHAGAGSLAVLHSGRGAIVVKVAGHRVGVLRGTGTTWIRLPRAGDVTLTASSAHASVDGFAITPR